MEEKYKIVMDYEVHEQFEIRFDEDGNHIAGDKFDRYEHNEPTYDVYEHLDNQAYDLWLDEFSTYDEAKQYIKELKEIDKKTKEQ